MQGFFPLAVVRNSSARRLQGDLGRELVYADLLHTFAPCFLCRDVDWFLLQWDCSYTTRLTLNSGAPVGHSDCKCMQKNMRLGETKPTIERRPQRMALGTRDSGEESIDKLTRMLLHCCIL